MIRCEEALEKLWEYLDRETEGEDHVNVEQHLRTCRDCCSREEFAKRLRERIRTACDKKAPDELARRIQRLLEHY